LDTAGLSWTLWDVTQKVCCADQGFRGVTDAGRAEYRFRAAGNGEFAGQQLFRWVGMNGL